MAEGTSTKSTLVGETEIRTVLSADKGSEADLLSWDVSSMTNTGDNFGSMIIAIKVFHSRKGERKSSSYVAKLKLQMATDEHDELMESFFRKECKFYLELLPQMNVILKSIERPSLCLPRFIYSCLAKGKEQIYLEDLREKGFQVLPCKKGLDVSHATLVLRELARLHASSLLLLKKCQEPMQVKYNYLDQPFPGYVVYFQSLFPKCLTTAVNLLKKRNKIGDYDKVMMWVENLKLRISNILTTERKNTKYNVILHGDVWSSNVLFRYDRDGSPTEVMLIDMSLCHRASPAFDLNYFLWSSLSSDVRRPNITSLLNAYHASFKDIVEAGGMAMPFTPEEIMAEFRNKNEFGFMIAMMFLAMHSIEDGDASDLKECEGDFMKIIVVMNKKLEHMDVADPRFKECFLAVIEELVDAGVIV